MQKISWLGWLGLLVGCQSRPATPPDALFETLSADHTGVAFVNRVADTKEFNIFNYRNFYNGGGVALGDVNDDGLPDLFLTSNFEDNQLYLNKGNFQFDNITAKAGVAGKRAWSTGVTFADANGDGRLDIYVCNSGNRPNDDRANELFINNGGATPTFTERAAEYGLNDQGFSTHAAFFDYDRDGDLDMYLLNNSFIPITRLGYRNLRDTRDPLGGHKLFRNNLIGPGGSSASNFTDVSEVAGIYGSIIGFGLGITVGDVNNDNWLDIYVSNDFYERDYLYLNQRDGTFKEQSKDWMGHESLSSMGADVADINNDGLLDIFVTDMLPNDDRRLKTTTTYEGYDLFQFKLKQDYHYQYSRNMLHLNNGDATFSEVGQLTGVSATDWSWGALLFDMDSDGRKDIFVANGIAKNLTDQDFVNFLGDEKNIRRVEASGKFDYKEFVDKIASEAISNYAFRNDGGLAFSNQAFNWGLGVPSFSNGSAYGDLDNDGDLDLVINNVNQPVSIYKNRSVEKNKTQFLRVKLVGYAKNPHGVGATVTLYQPGNAQTLQQMPNRGFQSSVDHTLVFGLGQQATVDSLLVVWGDDKRQVAVAPAANQTLTLTHTKAVIAPPARLSSQLKAFTDVTAALHIDYQHRESNFVDIKRDALLKQFYSTQGPALATGDVNSDGLTDAFLGGAAGQGKVLLLQRRDGTFAAPDSSGFADLLPAEATDAALFDADGDRDLDLYVVTGSNEFLPNDPELKDRFYLNDGKGHFTPDTRLPNLYDNGACVAPGDFDADGDTDLFVGSRLVSGQYGYSPPSYLLTNDGTGNFKNASKRYLPAIGDLGMVTDAAWADLDRDGFLDLVIVGDWMPITVFRNQRGSRLEKVNAAQLAVREGFWNRLHAADLDGDGDLDFVVGNLGRNTRLVADSDRPAELYVNDFDKNGTVEQVISCYTEDGKAYPMVLKTELQSQVPSLKKKFVQFIDYANQPIGNVFSPEQLQGAVVRKARETNSCALINNGNFQFSLQVLPVEAQFSPVFGIATLDYDHDGTLDVLLAGNFFDVIPEVGRYDANYGLVLRGLGQGRFSPVKPKDSGFFSRGQVRRMAVINGPDRQPRIILAKNNAAAQVFGLQSEKKALTHK